MDDVKSGYMVLRQRWWEEGEGGKEER